MSEAVQKRGPGRPRKHAVEEQPAPAPAAPPKAPTDMVKVKCFAPNVFITNHGATESELSVRPTRKIFRLDVAETTRDEAEKLEAADLVVIVGE